MKRLNYSNVMATVAVFVALGGTSYAAVTITGADVRDGSLTGADVRDNSLGQRDVDDDAVGSGEVRDGSLRARHFRSNVLPRWLLVDEAGNITEQSGGFTVISKPGINGQPATNPNIYIDAGSNLAGKGLSATIALQNRVDRTGDGVADPAFNGQASVGRCNSSAVNCVPTGTNEDDTLVVRALVDNTNVASQTRRVWVTVTD
ncbi:MAG: hypothetical protein M3N56_13565 [Actinomycetota bacterium]|jgi:hypothetical protein|nr:hypothetical protein [Actinomycetota bacterium]